MLISLWIVWFVTLITCQATVVNKAGRDEQRSTQDYYDEQLQIEPLRDGKVLSRFKFTMSTAINPQHGSLRRQQQSQPRTNVHVQTTKYVSPTLISLIESYKASQIELSLSSGRWNHLAWGTTPWINMSSNLSARDDNNDHDPIRLSTRHDQSNNSDTFKVPASGIELVAWLLNHDTHDNPTHHVLDRHDQTQHQQRRNDMTTRFIELTNSLSGLFCAGVSQGVEQSISNPTWTTPFDAFGQQRESLTPFLSLLPCTSKAGIGSLLNPHKLFDGEWTLLNIRLIKTHQYTLKVELEVGTVMDPVRLSRLQGHIGSRDFSFESLYDRTLKTICPVSNQSNINLIVPTHSKQLFNIEPKHSMKPIQVNQMDVATWNLEQTPLEPLNVRVTWPNENPFRYPSQDQYPSSMINVRRLLFAGHGQERGQIGIEIQNHQNQLNQIIWSEIWPWWFRGFIDGSIISNSNKSRIIDVSYEPPIARQRPTTLQSLIQLEPNSTTRLLLKFESSYLWYTEYPSDAHRGREIPGATISLMETIKETGLNQQQKRQLQPSPRIKLKLKTSTVLIDLPTPDFSMPYNVIILSSTVIALFFGSVVNGLVRQWFVVSLESDQEEEKNSTNREE
ncbi:Subunit of the glycosylphosphatidylinositol transamidase complex-like protein [Microbotryomycetes sp. JL221]|nr:Subunit of the glycosylphosphatidylinositol transamidase complex-like protein [Microbotryomycetes sp. JL221]